MHFVSRYRELMNVPAPEFSSVAVSELVDAVFSLEKPALEGIATRIEVVPESLTVQADRQLIEQVLINVVKNAIEALDGTPSPVIALSARLDHGRTLIDVEDNGAGIADDLLDQVFIPFFTTRREGSGIGLSLSRQIMNSHGGDISIESLPTTTRVRLVFA
jgi:C4-dicarboxylate-specific signal transduction histidine kinase